MATGNLKLIRTNNCGVVHLKHLKRGVAYNQILVYRHGIIYGQPFDFNISLKHKISKMSLTASLLYLS